MSRPDAPTYDAHWGYRTLDAERYERRRYGSPLRRWNLRMLERTLARALEGVTPGGLVLDAPCGTGILAPFLRGRGFRVVGADISPNMLAVARGRAQPVDVFRGDVELLPIRAKSVDAIVVSRFLMHLPPERRISVLQTFAAAARGPVIGMVCHPYTFKTMSRAVRRVLGLTKKTTNRLTRRQLEAEVAAAGLRLERVLPVSPGFSEKWIIVVRAAGPQ